MNIKSASAKLRRVVIMDDDPAFTEMLSNLMKGLGYVVVARPDPRTSDAYNCRDSDLVFLDILMPHVNGNQVLEQLARQNAQCPIVLMSGHEEYLDEAEKLAKKLNLWLLGVLQKPFRLTDVQQVLEGA